MGELTAAVINFNTAALTRRCTRSLLDAGVERLLVLDNGSAAADFERLTADHAADTQRVHVIRSDANLGFAEGSNRLFAEALSDARCVRVLLLNSDAVVEAGGLRKCLDAMTAGGHDLMGGRMLKPNVDPTLAESVDSLGMTLYKSLLASNRKSTADEYLGPTGGFAIYTRRFLEDVVRLHGHVFDPSYFCYAEDTDLCARARLLGYSAGYTDDVAAYHEGQGSTSGQYNDFILYHGIRNSIWMAAKSIPGWILFTNLPWVIALHMGIVLRHTLQGRVRTVLRLYWDAIAGMPAVLARRRVVQSTRRVTASQFRAHIDRQFYETRFLGDAIRDLFKRR